MLLQLLLLHHLLLHLAGTTHLLHLVRILLLLLLLHLVRRVRIDNITLVIHFADSVKSAGQSKRVRKAIASFTALTEA